MLFRVKNLGPIREAELDLSKDLIVLTGPNNTGKTYLTWAVYGLVPPVLLGTLPASDPFYQWAATSWNDEAGNPASEFVLPYQVLAESAVVELLHRLPDEFASPSNRFSSTSAELVYSGENLEWLDGASSDWTLAGRRYRIERRLEHLRFTLLGVERNDPVEGIDARAIQELAWFGLRSLLLTTFVGRGTVVFPVERLAINLFARELAANRTQLVDQLLEDAERSQALLRRRAGRYPRAIRDALQQALKLRSETTGHFADLADDLEREVLGGKLSKTEFDELQFTPDASTEAKPIGLHQSASVIKSLASIVWHLRYEALPGQRLIIDEPELNLHPDNQRRVARVLAKAVNRGLRIMMSTHSDYLVRELNNLIMLSQDSEAARGLVQEMGIDPLSTIKPDRLGVYLVNDGECRTVPVTETGFEVKTIDEEIHRLNRDSQTIYSRLFCE